MTPDKPSASEARNTDRELWRGPDEGNGSYYADSIHVTAGGGIGINVGGRVIVKPLRDWHALARCSSPAVNGKMIEEISKSWQILEGHGFPPEACGWPFKSIEGELPNAIDCAIDCLVRQREELSAQIAALTDKRPPMQEYGK